jgi:hypothetical protein
MCEVKYKTKTNQKFAVTKEVLDKAVEMLVARKGL